MAEEKTVALEGLFFLHFLHQKLQKKELLLAVKV